MQLSAVEITEVLKKRILSLKDDVVSFNTGKVISVFDGIVVVHGLSHAMQSEIIVFERLGIKGLVMNLEHETVSVVVLGDYSSIKDGDEVRCTGDLLDVPVGPELFGRVVNALGEPIDSLGSLEISDKSPIEIIAPGVIARKSVSKPLQTGIKAIDSMVPIGRGQRELIIGDRQTGKTAIAIDTIINQKNQNVVCVYVAIGQKASSIVNTVAKLKEYGAMEYTIVVVASASDSAVMQYIAPYSACSMGEYFRDRGEDALIIYDDLSKHAVAYRQISLLLRRPPGREAYPGDIFYLHSRLLERAACVNEEYITQITNGSVTGKSGSLTALPIVETQGGDVSAFVPTNVISITDGQIFLETDLFNAGIRPAINPGISVSRVGGAAQTKIIKKYSADIRIAHAQYCELAAFVQFASDLDDLTQKQIAHGKVVTEILKQKQYKPMQIAALAVVLYAVNKHYFTNVPLDDISDVEERLLEFLYENAKDLVNNISTSGLISNEDEAILSSLVKEFFTISGFMDS